MPTVNFKLLFDLSPNPYMLVDRDLRYVAANAAYERATGIAAERLLGRYIFDMFPNDPDDPANESARLLRDSFVRVLTTREADVIALIPYRVPTIVDGVAVLTERFWSATHTPVWCCPGDRLPAKAGSHGSRFEQPTELPASAGRPEAPKKHDACHIPGASNQR